MLHLNIPPRRRWRWSRVGRWHGLPRARVGGAGGIGGGRGVGTGAGRGVLGKAQPTALQVAGASAKWPSHISGSGISGCSRTAASPPVSRAASAGRCWRWTEGMARSHIVQRQCESQKAPSYCRMAAGGSAPSYKSCRCAQACVHARVAIADEQCVCDIGKTRIGAVSIPRTPVSLLWLVVCHANPIVGKQCT